ncbi:inositol monophosphatase family protein [Primorskyibacter aestuariivivens]|uniref:inositol monophosphatase family protein n=1 Tax=Primorskyibacter aestuariivivens TaxID=1888912 RepID=UPI002301DD69|nr:inositol monophosphatase family protein [Primorskyibacter aestuariivivens]MDA7430633.1 inositol monophosphatase family protein [Primorskyibacter aestuariivivens]
MLNSSQLAARSASVENVIRKAGKKALDRFHARDFETETKGAQDFVSAVDRETEALIRNCLEATYPDTTFMGEETGGSIDGRTWVIDPIDGTSNYVRGVPFWCLSIALIEDGKAILGSIYDPCNDEMFSAWHGGGCHLNGKPVEVSDTMSADRAVLGVSFSFKSSAERHHSVLKALMDHKALYRFCGAGALTLAHCAVGRLDGFWEDHIMPWDVAAGIVLATEAGAHVSDYASNDGWRLGNEILVSTPSMTEFFVRATGVSLAATQPSVA